MRHVGNDCESALPTPKTVVIYKKVIARPKVDDGHPYGDTVDSLKMRYVFGLAVAFLSTAAFGAPEAHIARGEVRLDGHPTPLMGLNSSGLVNIPHR